jgi:hypothetical protein
MTDRRGQRVGSDRGATERQQDRPHIRMRALVGFRLARAREAGPTLAQLGPSSSARADASMGGGTAMDV